MFVVRQVSDGKCLCVTDGHKYVYKKVDFC